MRLFTTATITIDISGDLAEKDAHLLRQRLDDLLNESANDAVAQLDLDGVASAQVEPLEVTD